MPFRIDPYAPLEDLLVEGVEDNVARKIGRKTPPRKARTAEGALSDPAIGATGPGYPHPFEVENHLRPIRAEHLDGVLVAQVIAALDRIEHMGLDAVVRPEGRIEASLRGPAVRTGRIDLAQHGHVRMLRNSESRHQTRQPSSNNQHFMHDHIACPSGLPRLSPSLADGCKSPSA